MSMDIYFKQEIVYYLYKVDIPTHTNSKKKNVVSLI